MINRKSWEEFRHSGMLWFMNMILHTFGWAIVVDVNEEGKVTDCYPARVKFRGFSEKSNTKGYIAVSQYLKDNIEDLLKESEE